MSSGADPQLTANTPSASDEWVPYGRQDIDDDDIAAVVSVLRSDFLTQGPAVPAFEEAVAAVCGASHGVALNSATSALHVACLALGVGAGDLVWTTPITFIASANCALYCGAAVDFVDIDPATFNMSVDALAAKLEDGQRNGRLPKVVIPVHMAGLSCDMARIAELAQRYGFKVIEDASHAIGGEYDGARVGSCRYSDITVFSFHPVKIITSAEGGMAMTSDRGLAESMALLRSHGMTRDADKMRSHAHGGWYYEQIALGFNYRMTDVQAALGVSQLRRIASFVDRRRGLAARYDSRLSALPLTPQAQSHLARSAYHLYIIRVEAGRRRAVYDALRAEAIGVNLHYIPVYLQPYYQDLGFRRGLCPAAEAYYAEAITIPLYPSMSDAQQDKVIATLKRALVA